MDTNHMNQECPWISLRQAGRMIGMSGSSVRRLADRGLVTSRRLPGCRPRVERESLRRLVEACTRPGKPAA